MSYRVLGLEAGQFKHLYGLADSELEQLGCRRYIADKRPGFPDRIEVRDAEPGESLILLNHVHQPAATAYRASHAIFVREGATRTYDAVGVIPEVMRIRPISLRAFDLRDEMIDAELLDGERLEPAVTRMLARSETAYLHAHYAVRGCYAARIERA